MRCGSLAVSSMSHDCRRNVQERRTFSSHMSSPVGCGRRSRVRVVGGIRDDSGKGAGGALTEFQSAMGGFSLARGKTFMETWLHGDHSLS